MELVTCPNCVTVYGGANELCPNCDADHSGADGRIELDVTARAAVTRLGGLFGGILELDEGRFVLWCARGVCLISEHEGLLWERLVGSRVDGVALRGDAVLVSRGPETLRLDTVDGSPIDAGG